MYLPSVFMHELGHTFGLRHPHVYDGLMQDPRLYTAPRSDDKRRLRNIYENHSSDDH